MLGPLLLIFYLNGIVNCFHNYRYLLYADDIVIHVYRDIDKVDPLNDVGALQSDLKISIFLP